jgi:hypothetical protein
MKKNVPKKIWVPLMALMLGILFCIPTMATYYDQQGTNYLVKGFLDIPELSSAPGTPDTTAWRLYTYNDAVYIKDDAGNAIVLEITDGGLQINTDGAENGDVTIDAADVLTLTTPDTIVVNGGTLAFEIEGTDDAHETTLAFTDPTADRTITIPDYTGSVPLIIGQGYTQTEQAGAGTADVTGSSIELADGWFTEGRTLKYTVGGTVTGANASISVALYFEDGAVCTLSTAGGAAGDYVAEFTVVAASASAQRIIGNLQAEAGAETKIDYATDDSDTAAVGTIPVKLQITSADAGDTITAEYVRIEYWNKAD